ncbi:MAG: type II secretion system protein [Candidatus Shapirobacteria bacterium]|nr:type II secretion system protein [Candidatus Shapirobacteria bacterium]
MKNLKKMFTLRIRQLTETKGFTLIELLVVISIIGILASLTLVSYSGAQKQTRDTQRRSDLNQYRNSLENYAGSNNGLYPLGINTIANLCGTGKPLTTSYIASCPADPITTYLYGFYSSSTGDGYVIYAQLETGGYWEVCSIGKSGKVTVKPTDSSCDL